MGLTCTVAESGGTNTVQLASGQTLRRPVDGSNSIVVIVLQSYLLYPRLWYR